MRVELDKRALFALASDTRLDILKSLQPMRRTVTQLAETLGIDKAAIHRHLKTLEEGGFVRRYEDHGFVYYGLSWKSRDILSPGENTRVVILLSACFVLVGLVAFIMIAIAVAEGVVPFGEDRAIPLIPGDEGDTDGYAAASYSLYPLLIAASIMLSVGAVFAAISARKTLRRPRQPGMRKEDTH